MKLEGIISRCTSKGWRCLLVIAEPLNESIDLGFITGSNLCVSKKADHSVFDEYNVSCSENVDFRLVHKLLGGEYDSVFLSLRSTYGWPGNLLALSMDFVSRGGVYGLFVPRHLLETLFGRYFLGLAYSNPNHVVITGEGVDYDFYGAEPVKSSKPAIATSDRLIGKLIALTVNSDQAKALRSLPSFLYSRKYRLLLLTGDRGRGKSSVLGLYAAYIMSRGRGRFIVTSRSIYGVQSFFRMLIRGLEKLGIRYSASSRGGLVARVSSGKALIEYVEPWRVSLVKEFSKPLLVDEAAGVGVARVRRWYRDIGKVIASSTIHGYEGSGRVLVKYVKEVFRDSMVIRLKNPVRYYPGDPLEKLIYRVFHLDAEPPSIKGTPSPDKLRLVRNDREELVKDYDLLRRIYGLLVTAHYRNEPDDLVLIIDTDYFEIYSGVVDGDIIGVLQVRMEETGIEKAMLIGNVLKRYGILNTEMPGVLRIVRIAVHPDYQRRGFGSKMLTLLEEAYAGRASLIGAFFSGFDTVRFWLRNGYTPIYISPRYNRATGEKNIVVLKSTEQGSRGLVDEAASILYQRIVYASHVLYRDVSSERLSWIMNYLKSKGYTVGSVETDCRRMKVFLEASDHYETVIDQILKYWDLVDFNSLDELSRTLLVARVLQGKDLLAISSFTGIKPDSITDRMDKLILSLISLLYDELCR